MYRKTITRYKRQSKRVYIELNDFIENKGEIDYSIGLPSWFYPNEISEWFGFTHKYTKKATLDQVINDILDNVNDVYKKYRLYEKLKGATPHPKTFLKYDADDIKELNIEELNERDYYDS